uniref:CSON008428 protein n=1 Tax=Culicoides sonorensis TaxID=179676 RepID=A0A336LYX6_CULSO
MKHFVLINVLFVIVCLLNEFVDADKFKCYECKSINDNKCIDKPKDLSKVECQRSKACAKYTMNGPTGIIVERGCAESLTWDKICYNQGINASHNSVSILFETCTKEKCNGSAKFSLNTLLTMFLAVTSIFRLISM